METQFYILLSLQTAKGFTDYGQFFLGNDRDSAQGLFSTLKGRDPKTADCILHLDLLETVNGLPEKIKSICCTLDEIGDNTKLIAKEVFRLKNLEELL
jgi:hypothetical protein